ncbi:MULTISPECIES: type II toxin-antitoxin system HicB family antitoxin [Acetobacterium]|jgi:predicted RNase H-like HicB family nuclease|uniref:HicB family protein n=1 Tax=Acetobacterium wieringae TaxID=52694 RepID=A0A5D0WQ19_9FIRM|nr:MULTISPECIES: type II toxin-antitoxin system HicB family antitoxin [Acetobacterium]TYC85781.1 HicB family protein [Acetobacterium wieringae]
MLSAYPAIFHEEDGAYWVEFPDLPGCQTVGESIGEVMEEAQEALGLYLASLIEDEEEIKPASDIKSIVAEDDSFTSLVACDITQDVKSARAMKKTLTIPDWLNNMAEKNSINFSQTLQKALMEKLHIA